jgi:uncharacterized protein YcfJ
MNYEISGGSGNPKRDALKFQTMLGLILVGGFVGYRIAKKQNVNSAIGVVVGIFAGGFSYNLLEKSNFFNKIYPAQVMNAPMYSGTPLSSTTLQQTTPMM